MAEEEHVICVGGEVIVDRRSKLQTKALLRPKKKRKTRDQKEVVERLFGWERCGRGKSNGRDLGWFNRYRSIFYVESVFQWSSSFK
jgi:hypothetical protein